MTEVFQVLIDSLALGSLYALFALGITLVFGVMSLVNFAYGELIMLSALSLVLTAELPLVLRIVVAIIVPAAAALIYDIGVFRPIRGASATTLLVSSFGLSFFIQSLVLTIRGNPRPEGADISPWLFGGLEIGSVTTTRLALVIPAVVAVVLVGLALLLRKTTIGMQLRAASEDLEMARMLGVRANSVIAWAFAISGVVAGISAILLIAQTGLYTTDMGLTPVLIGFIAAVLGGLGSLTGAVLGSFFIATAATLLQTYLPFEFATFRDAFLYLGILALLVFRPYGLVRSRSELRRV